MRVGIQRHGKQVAGAVAERLEGVVKTSPLEYVVSRVAAPDLRTGDVAARIEPAGITEALFESVVGIPRDERLQQKHASAFADSCYLES